MALIPITSLGCLGRTGSSEFDVPDTPAARAAAAKSWDRHRHADRCALVGQVELAVGAGGDRVRVLPERGLVAERDIADLVRLDGFLSLRLLHAPMVRLGKRMIIPKTRCLPFAEVARILRAEMDAGMTGFGKERLAFATWFVGTFEAGAMEPGRAVPAKPPRPPRGEPRLSRPGSMFQRPPAPRRAGADAFRELRGFVDVVSSEDDPFIEIKLCGLVAAVLVDPAGCRLESRRLFSLVRHEASARPRIPFVVHVRGLDRGSQRTWAEFAADLSGARPAEVRVVTDGSGPGMPETEAL